MHKIISLLKEIDAIVDEYIAKDELYALERISILLCKSAFLEGQKIKRETKRIKVEKNGNTQRVRN